MRKILTALSGLACLSAGAQGIVNNGAYIVMSGAAQIYVDGGASGGYLSQSNGRITPSATGIITIEGDWTNNAGNTGFTADAGTVVMNGAAESINGSSSTTFYNLTLQGTNTKTLNVNTSVGGVSTTTGVLSLGSRPLSLNSRMLTITNSATSAVTYTTGYVLSETNAALNPSIMRWNTGAFAATYNYPFGTAGGTQIPLNFAKTTATAASVDIATRPTATSANTPWASGVTHMFDPTLAQDGSDEAVIDRWWEITSSAALTASVTFRYLGSENTLIVPYNTGNLGAQYWAGGGWFPDNSNIGSAPAVLVGVGAVTAPGLSITTTYTPWVLSSTSAPLPIELTKFVASCDNGAAVVNWATASEQNNDFFTVLRSDDGLSFREIGTVSGSGTTSQAHTYSFTDPSPLTGTTYYRLRQTDYNGSSHEFNLVSLQPCGGKADQVNAYASGNTIDVIMNLAASGDYTVNVLDARGRLIASRPLAAGEGYNHFELRDLIPAAGVYFINITGPGEPYSHKIYVTND